MMPAVAASERKGSVIIICCSWLLLVLLLLLLQPDKSGRISSNKLRATIKVGQGGSVGQWEVVRLGVGSTRRKGRHMVAVVQGAQMCMGM
jgi:hypothetical protein